MKFNISLGPPSLEDIKQEQAQLIGKQRRLLFWFNLLRVVTVIAGVAIIIQALFIPPQPMSHHLVTAGSVALIAGISISLRQGFLTFSAVTLATAAVASAFMRGLADYPPMALLLADTFGGSGLFLFYEFKNEIVRLGELIKSLDPIPSSSLRYVDILKACEVNATCDSYISALANDKRKPVWAEAAEICALVQDDSRMETKIFSEKDRDQMHREAYLCVVSGRPIFHRKYRYTS